MPTHIKLPATSKKQGERWPDAALRGTPRDNTPFRLLSPIPPTNTAPQNSGTQRAIAIPLGTAPTPSLCPCSAGRCPSFQRRASCPMQPRQSPPLTAERRPQLLQRQQLAWPSEADQALPRRRQHRGGRRCTTGRWPNQPRHAGGGSRAAAQQRGQRPWRGDSAGGTVGREVRAEAPGAAEEEETGRPEWGRYGLLRACAPTDRHGGGGRAKK